MDIQQGNSLLPDNDGDGTNENGQDGGTNSDRGWHSDTLENIGKRLHEIEAKSGRNAAKSASLELLNMAMRLN